MDRFQIEALCFGVTEEYNNIYWSTGIVLVLDQYQHYTTGTTGTWYVSSSQYSHFRNYAPPHFYRKYAPPFFDGSFLNFLRYGMPG